VVCGLAGEPEIERARRLAPIPVVAFDGVQGADFGSGRDVQIALPFAPSREISSPDLFLGIGQARRAVELVAGTVADGASDRASVLAGLRGLASFDRHGDPTNPDVWLWRMKNGEELDPIRPLHAAP
jgi:hypothetical protein